jgi:outer membrane protein
MLRMFRRSVTIAVVVGTLLVAGGAGGETLPAAVIAVIDMDRIIRDSSAGQSLRSQVESQREAFQTEIAAREATLREEDQKLAQQRAVLAPEVFAQKRQEFGTRVAEVQREVQTRKTKLDRAYNEGIEQIRRATIEILDELAKDRGFNVVIPLRQVLIAASVLNLTDEVLARLNERLPSVDAAMSDE